MSHVSNKKTPLVAISLLLATWATRAHRGDRGGPCAEPLLTSFLSVDGNGDLHTFTNKTRHENLTKVRDPGLADVDGDASNAIDEADVDPGLADVEPDAAMLLMKEVEDEMLKASLKAEFHEILADATHTRREIDCWMWPGSEAVLLPSDDSPLTDVRIEAYRVTGGKRNSDDPSQVKLRVLYKMADNEHQMMQVSLSLDAKTGSGSPLFTFWVDRDKIKWWHYGRLNHKPGFPHTSESQISINYKGKVYKLNLAGPFDRFTGITGAYYLMTPAVEIQDS